MSSAACFFGSLTAVLVIATYASCLEHISCPCGTSNKNYTFCVNDTWDEPFTCDKWAHCETCEDNITHCVTCPTSRTGLFCLEVESGKVRRKRQFINPAEQNYPGRFGVCPTLESPDFGAISCRETGNYRVCTGRCLPGYVFDDEVYTNEITLECRGGFWKPRRYFPPCISQGHCSLRMNGAGSFNCTTGMDGTRCDVWCDGRYHGRYHCYPERGWNPPLPHCAVPKRDEETNIRPCRCENGGVCDAKGKCTCPRRTRGAYCEHLEKEKADCPDPGIPRGGERMNSDGSDASYPRSFEEGESVIYSCKGDLLLQGLSFITCKSDGTWSSPRPQCIRSRDPTIYCPDPGQIPFGIRRNGDGTFTGSTQVYTQGQSVIYSCRQGYELNGESVITCLRTKGWSRSKPRCVRRETTTGGSRGGQIYCPHPGVNENSVLIGNVPNSQLDQEFPPGAELRYNCKRGFEPEGSLILYCLSTGRWTSAAPTCRSTTPSTTTPGPSCRHPGKDINGEIEDHPLIDPRKRGQTFPPGTELKFRCKEGFVIEGSVNLYCLRSGEWSSAPPTCLQLNILTTTAVSPSETRIHCTSPGVDPNAEVVGFPPIDPRNVGTGFDAGEVLSYTCRDGYERDGQESITCQRNGQWSDLAPRCILKSRVAAGPTNVVQCMNNGPISNGLVVVFRVLEELRQPSSSNSDQDNFEFPVGTTLQYSCEDGYFLRGESDLVCENTGFWSAEVPICVEDCGRSRLQTTRRITHGTKTVAGEWPWTVAIVATRRNITGLICGGVLLDRRTVLTAAHCLEGLQHITLYFGKFHRSDRLDDRKVETRISSRLVSHPGFNNVTYDNDIAMVKFVPDVRYTERIQPICLPTQRSTRTNLVPEQKGYVTGWGLTENQLPSEELLMAHLPVQPNQVCIDAYARANFTLNLTDGMFCAGYPRGRTSACTGDSGSPLVFYDRNTDRHTVEGLVSFGRRGECDLPDRYTVFTRVSYFMPWILRNWPR
ncbi:limulus clotting factor C [Nephila pilipes]|uniref:Limulus clotting factor C n=1 Tax=Nephila pilipes TaxID=299642 RepID=A0A8X6PZT5_NEPPI|nr:limulus clotting factor C [Nephila pilipes]